MKNRYILDYCLTRISEDNFGQACGKASLGQACVEISKEEMGKLIEHLVVNNFTECHKTKVKITNG